MVHRRLHDDVAGGKQLGGDLRSGQSQLGAPQGSRVPASAPGAIDRTRVPAAGGAISGDVAAAPGDPPGGVAPRGASAAAGAFPIALAGRASDGRLTPPSHSWQDCAACPRRSRATMRYDTPAVATAPRRPLAADSRGPG